MQKKFVGLSVVVGLTVLANLVYAETSKTNAACDPKSSQACGMTVADAKTAAPAPAAQTEAKPAAPAPAAQTEAKPAAPAPAVQTEAKPAAPAPAVQAEAKPAAGENASLSVDEIAVATAMENHAPQGAAESFPATTEKLYCYTKLSGGKEGDTVVHKWSHAGQMVSEVTLKVNGSPWRTFSSKTLGEDAAGAWTVEIVQNNQVIKTAKFEVTKQDAAKPEVAK